MRFSILAVAPLSCLVISCSQITENQAHLLTKTIPICTDIDKITGAVIEFGAADRTMYASTTIDAKGQITINPSFWNHSSPGSLPFKGTIAPSTVQALVRLASAESFWTLKSDKIKYVLGADGKPAWYFTANPIKFIKINLPCASHTVTVSLDREGETLRYTRASIDDRRLRVLTLKQLRYSTGLSPNEIARFDDLYELLKDLEAGVEPIFPSLESIPRWGRRSLLDIALKVAKNGNNGYPDSIRYIETTRQKLGNISSKQNETVYLVMMKGHFTLNSVPRPIGAKPPSGNNLNFTVNGNTGEVESLGSNNRPTNLRQFGEVKDLTQFFHF